MDVINISHTSTSIFIEVSLFEDWRKNLQPPNSIHASDMDPITSLSHQLCNIFISMHLPHRMEWQKFEL